jgi:large subunit ribosomal protein L23
MSLITLKPRMSEKSYGLSSSGVYVFDVDKSVNKHEIAKAVEDTYEVSVVDVRTVLLKGKIKRLYRNKRFVTGKRADVKKAYVTLKEGDAIPIFAAIEEEEAKAEKTSKTLEKAAEKQAKKEEKKTKKSDKKGDK